MSNSHIKNLSLDIVDGPHISLHELNINWEKFNLDCVRYFKKWSHLNKKSINLKSLNAQELEISSEKQVINRYQDWAIHPNSNDVFLRIIQYDDFIEKGYEKGDNLISIKDYNTDLQQKFPYVIETLNAIEAHTKIKFNNVKLSYLLPFGMQPIHIDWDQTVYHLPIVTNENVFFCEGDKIYSMLDSDKLYILDTNIPHTVINASGTLSRLHLIAHPHTTEPNANIEQIQNNNAVEIDKTFLQYLRYAKNYISNASAAERELNDTVYKKIKIILLKYSAQLK